MMRRAILAASALTFVVAATQTPPLTLTNLKGPIAKAAGKAEAKSIAELWTQILALPQKSGQGPNIPAAIPSNFDTASLLVPTWGSGDIPPSAAPDVVGAFRFICGAGQVIADDPIVYPGQPGNSHLHQFFGNAGANASSTYDSLRTSGDSTCENRLNRSAYWMPAMLNGLGQVIRPDFIGIYYKRLPQGSPRCKVQGIACVDIPRGLRFIFGHDMLTGKAPTGATFWQLVGDNGNTVINPHSPDIPTAMKGYREGLQLEVRSDAPDCWNGKDLDSPDHRSHVAYASYDSTGVERCPSTHPYVIPKFTMAAFYTIAPGEKPGLSSDNMPGMPPMIAGTSFHGDYFEAWDEPTRMTWLANCIDKLLNCSGGDLGNGRQMRRGPLVPADLKAKPRLVKVPTL